MKYAMCPNCGRRLCKGEPGTKVEIDCPKCGTSAVVIIEDDNLQITSNKGSAQKDNQPLHA